jgi:hypothetical protein
LVISFTEEYPFITLYSFQCLELLQPGNWNIYHIISLWATHFTRY